MSRVVVVTGGGAGIGAAIAEEVGRQGAFVVTVDPMVTLDGSGTVTSAEPTTAERIVAAGGQARASDTSVTDADAVNELFDGLADEFGGVDAVINVAGISRPTSFASGSEEDWKRVLDVHLNGYRNVLEAALPLMAEARHGRILGVTSGSGWRPADVGAYSCAKRAVAALTWQLGWQAPPGVVINAISPIAVTRMVTAALAKAPAPSSAAPSSGGLSLGSMPEPEALGPLGAHLVSDEFSWCSGEVIFAGGAEVALVEPPRFLEVVRTSEVRSLAQLFETTLGTAFVDAEAKQLSGGGSNPRFPGVFDDDEVLAAPVASRCAIVTDRAGIGDAIASALSARGVKSEVIGRREALPADVDAVVVALRGAEPAAARAEWERTLQEHDDIVEDILADAMWARRVADYAAATERSVRLVTITDATTSAGRSRGQASAQLSRASRKATKDRVAAFAVAADAHDHRATAELASYLLCSTDAPALSGAELVVGDGWVGLRSHPRPSASLVFGGPAIPSWFDNALKVMVR